MVRLGHEPLETHIFASSLRRIKIRDESRVRNNATALGVMSDEAEDIRGLWIENTEGAKFWLRVMNELKSPGATTS